MNALLRRSLRVRSNSAISSRSIRRTSPKTNSRTTTMMTGTISSNIGLHACAARDTREAVAVIPQSRSDPRRQDQRVSGPLASRHTRVTISKTSQGAARLSVRPCTIDS